MVSIPKFLKALLFSCIISTPWTVLLGSSAAIASDNVDPCWAFTGDAEYVDYTLVMRLEHRDIEMHVPKIFLVERWDQVNGARQTATLFRVTPDRFQPVTRAQTPKLKFEYYSFLLGDVVDLRSVAENLLEFAGVSTPRLPLSEYDERAAVFGLQEFVSKVTEGLRSNIYLSRAENGEIETLLECDTDEGVRYPMCWQFFKAASGMDVKISYGIKFLPAWREMQSDIDAFLECATSKN